MCRHSNACSSLGLWLADRTISIRIRRLFDCCEVSFANKSSLKVIDADVMPLIEIAHDQNKSANAPELVASGEASPSSGNGLAAGSGGDRSGNQTLPLPEHIKDEKDLEPYERLFANVTYWKRIGEEYQNPLIVTGTVLFTAHSRAGIRTARAGSVRPVRSSSRGSCADLHGA